jgi:pimeloyl-ACP methyl ester carboxylesterase
MLPLHTLDPNPTGKPAVLLLHGLGANNASWTLQMPPLVAAGFRPLAPDTPGFGRSAGDSRGWSIRRVAGCMAQLLEDAGSSPAYVVGLSMGGTIAQQLVLDYPHLARKLVLVSTFARLRPETPSGWFYFLQRILLVNTLGLPAQAKFVAGRIFPGPQNEALRELLVASILEADPRVYRKAMLSLGLFNSVKRLGEIRVPTLILTGEKDTTVSPGRQKILADGIRGARQVVISGAGHAVPVDQPELFNRELLSFLQERSKAALFMVEVQ